MNLEIIALSMAGIGFGLGLFAAGMLAMGSEIDSAWPDRQRAAAEVIVCLNRRLRKYKLLTVTLSLALVGIGAAWGVLTWA